MSYGLVINNFGLSGIRLDGAGNNVIQANFIGTNASGTIAHSNDRADIEINSSPDNVIGGMTPETRNLISGNGIYGIYMYGTGTSGNRFEGNYVGVDVTGSAALGNGRGLLVENAANNVFGPDNVISANAQYGPYITGSSATGNVVQGNYIGTDATGTLDLGNANRGVHLQDPSGNTIGGTAPGAGSYLGTRYWRVDRTGRGFFNGGTQVGGADFAEQLAVAGGEAGYEPGDVLVISTRADRTVELSTGPFSTAVIGVYSSEPGVLAGAPDSDDPLGGIPVAITGIVPCKVTTENGRIQRGDLLVTSSTPGHAMRAGSNPPQGTVLGKTLGELEEGTGVIQVLVSLQ